MSTLYSIDELVGKEVEALLAIKTIGIDGNSEIFSLNLLVAPEQLYQFWHDEDDGFHEYYEGQHEQSIALNADDGDILVDIGAEYGVVGKTIESVICELDELGLARFVLTFDSGEKLLYRYYDWTPLYEYTNVEFHKAPNTES